MRDMSTIPSTQDEWTLHAMNIHGVFFERRCVDVVTATSDWNVVATNYPVEFPPPNGPWRGKESSLDIWARSERDPDTVIDVLMECKKANPEFVNWIFFERDPPQEPSPFFFARIINTPNVTGPELWTSRLVVQRGVSGEGNLLSNDAREVRGDYLKHQGGNKTKTSNASIQEAAYQVALACRAIVQEETALLERARSAAEHPSPPWLSKVYVPVIVTTANLWRVDFKSNDTNLRTGEIALDKAMLTPVQSLVYEYPLPKHLQYAAADPLPALKQGIGDDFARMHILVVQAEAMSGLLLNLFASQT